MPVRVPDPAADHPTGAATYDAARPNADIAHVEAGADHTHDETDATAAATLADDDAGTIAIGHFLAVHQAAGQLIDSLDLRELGGR